MDLGALQAAFAAAVPECQRGLALGAAALRALTAAAESTPPGLAVDPRAFGARLARSAQGPDPVEALGTLFASDLALAVACKDGDRRAVALLDARLVQAVPSVVARLRADAGFCDEVTQLLRQKLLVGSGSGRPKIDDYGGRGALGQWLRAAALRVALNLLTSRKSTAIESAGALARMAAAGPDPEMTLIKRRYAPEFQAALEGAVDSLPPKERNLLRLYFLQGLTVEEIGRMEGAHKSTISRWLSRARKELLADVRARLGAKLRLTDGELDSLLSVVRSQLDISVRRVLA